MPSYDQRLGIALDQHRQIEVAINLCCALNAAAESVDGQKIGQTGLQRLDDGGLVHNAKQLAPTNQSDDKSRSKNISSCAKEI